MCTRHMRKPLSKFLGVRLTATKNFLVFKFIFVEVCSIFRFSGAKGRSPDEVSCTVFINDIKFCIYYDALIFSLYMFLN